MPKTTVTPEIVAEIEETTDQEATVNTAKLKNFLNKKIVRTAAITVAAGTVIVLVARAIQNEETTEA